MKKRALLYLFALGIPVFLGMAVAQSDRYARIASEVDALKASQREYLESNKRLIAGLAVLGSSDRVESIAREVLGMEKIKPEDVLQVRIARGAGDIDG